MLATESTVLNLFIHKFTFQLVYGKRKGGGEENNTRGIQSSASQVVQKQELRSTLNSILLGIRKLERIFFVEASASEAVTNVPPYTSKTSHPR